MGGYLLILCSHYAIAFRSVLQKTLGRGKFISSTLGGSNLNEAHRHTCPTTYNGI